MERLISRTLFISYYRRLSTKKEVLDKKPYHFWKIWRRAIFLCIYLNFEISDENWLFLGAAGAKKHSTVYFLMLSIHSTIRVVLYGSLLASNIYWKYFSKILKVIHMCTTGTQRVKLAPIHFTSYFFVWCWNKS